MQAYSLQLYKKIATSSDILSVITNNISNNITSFLFFSKYVYV